MDPSPENLAKLRRERIDRARNISPAQKLTAGPQLFSLALESTRAGIQLQNPNATEAEIQLTIRQRLEKKGDVRRSIFNGPASRHCHKPI